jgi:hypothetical protein
MLQNAAEDPGWPPRQRHAVGAFVESRRQFGACDIMDASLAVESEGTGHILRTAMAIRPATGDLCTKSRRA